ncbi:MAG: PIG-L family deacetylase [Candidatus Pacebacteria bacterium]|nr:PIG-L family deacetylase [Candidatus Paceibacterota bacterium]
MTLTKPTADIFVPNGNPVDEALEATTIVGIGAHQDDIEILAYNGIIKAFADPAEGFGSITVTNGSGSSRANVYANYSDDEMQTVRRREQIKAAIVGEYTFAAFLDFASSEVKDPTNSAPVKDLTELLKKTRPKTIYTHNPADKHDTHVAVLICVIEALRQLPPDCHPSTFLGCETWRDLDWLCDEDKQTLDVSAHENLATALLGVFDSQICGGKRYDLATMGRRRANATYLESHATDQTSALTLAMDLLPLLTSETNVTDYVEELIQHFRQDVQNRIKKLERQMPPD